MKLVDPHKLDMIAILSTCYAACHDGTDNNMIWIGDTTEDQRKESIAYLNSHFDIKAKDLRDNQKFKRRKILIVSEFTISKNDIYAALDKLPSLKAITKDGYFIQVLDSKEKIKKLPRKFITFFNDFTLSDVIYIQNISKKQEKNNVYAKLVNSTIEFFVHPPLNTYKKTKFNREILVECLKNTLLYNKTINNDEYSKLWKNFAYFDHVLKLIRAKVSYYNRNDELEKFFDVMEITPEDIGLEEYIQFPINIKKNKNRILFINMSVSIKIHDIKKTIVNKGFNLDDFDFVINKDVFNFDASTLKNSKTYKCVIVGTIPHSLKGISGASSLLELLRGNPEIYPKCYALYKSNKQTLHSSTNSLEKVLEEIKHDFQE